MMSILQRQCGPCNACCNAVGVEELGKPYWTNCQYQTEKGCGCYGKHPPSCKHFQCLWLCGNFDREDHPLKLGAIFMAEEDGGIWITVMILREDANFKRIQELAYLCQTEPDIRGVRFAKVDQVVNTAYKVDKTKYEEMGKQGADNVWGQYSDSPFWFLDAPQRIPLKVIAEQS